MAELSIVAPEPRKHRDALFDFYGKIFSDRKFTALTYYEAVALCRRAYFTNSHYDWQASRIGLLGETIVSHYGVWGYEMRIGAARVRTGGIGSVATHGAFRRRGFMDQTARASLAAMRELGYDMTLLFGIANFYDRFGYISAWSETSISVDSEDLPSAAPGAPIRRFAPGRRADLTDLYNTHHAAMTGTAVRPTYLAPVNFWQGRPVGYLWSDAKARPSGYVVVRRRGNRLGCTEYCGEAEQALRVLGVLARRWHCSEVQLHTVPYESGLCKLVRRGTCRSETAYQRSGGPMVQVLNLTTTLTKLSGELSRRLSSSHLKGWQGELLIAGAGEQVALAFANGAAAVAPPRRTRHAVRGGNEIAQLLLGTDDPAEVAEAAGMELSGDAQLLLPILFPAQHPQLSEADRY